MRTRAARLRMWLVIPASLSIWAASGCTHLDSAPHGRMPTPIAGTTNQTRPSFRPESVPMTPTTPASSPRRVHLGNSVEGRPITLELFGTGPDTMLIFGGIHGNEPNSAALARRLADDLARNPQLWRGRTIGIIPAANPDGLDRGTRSNANGVDLNRNFPAENWQRVMHGKRCAHGHRPASEPETRALLVAIDLIKPNRILSIHAIFNGRYCTNYDGPAAELAKRMAELNSYPLRPSMGYPTPGSFGSWAGIDHELPTITLELPQGRPPQQCWKDNRTALISFITTSTDTSPPPAGY